MRVVHVITRLIVGGAQENTIATVLGLRSRPGVQVALLAGPTAGPEGSLEEVVRSAPGLFECISPLVRPLHPWKDMLALLQLVRRFRSLKPDLVHTHSGKAGFLGRVAAYLARVPVIVHTIHGPSFGAFQGGIANAVYTTAERIAGRVTDHFVVVAGAMKELYLAAGIGRPDQYTKIYSGFDLEPFIAARDDAVFRKELGFFEHDIVVGKIARLFKLKGHDDLLAIAPCLVRREPRFKFLLIGDGPWMEKFKRAFAAAGLGKHVVFAGLVPPQNVPRYIGIMDIVVHLSRREGLPRALPQALAAGKPVIAYDCDGAPEVCIDGETGFLVKVGDLECLVNRLCQLAADENLRRRLGHTGRELVRRTFSVDKMVEDIYTLYVRLIAEKKQRLDQARTK
ncbi:MAG: glycosyltransferase family 4 protein [Verrucomicrobiae bacterium]|nr:glycosyltransferase family 4 protein [Verrucomicrobiae bacterium]